MKKLLPLLLAILLLATGCDKRTDTPAADAENFAPGKAGSTWTYDTRNLTTSATGSFVLTKTSRDTVVNGKTYNVYTNSGGANAYYAQVGADYFQFTTFVGTDQKLELLYLKNNLPAGTTWEQSVSISLAGIGTISTKLTNRVEEKGISYTVGSTTYPNVIRIKTTIGAITIPGFPLPIAPVSDINTYYANEVGRIFNTTKVNITVPTVAPIDINEETSLRTSSIVR